jgi:hypothetical protein
MFHLFQHDRVAAKKVLPSGLSMLTIQHLESRGRPRRVFFAQFTCKERRDFVHNLTTETLGQIIHFTFHDYSDECLCYWISRKTVFLTKKHTYLEILSV